MNSLKNDYYLIFRSACFLLTLAAISWLLVAGKSTFLMILYLVVIIAWFVSSIAIAVFTHPTEKAKNLRDSVYAMIDMYLMVTFACNSGYEIAGLTALATYVIGASAFEGIIVGGIAGVVGVFGLIQIKIAEAQLGILSFLNITAVAGLSFACGYTVRYTIKHVMSHVSRLHMVHNPDKNQTSTISIHEYEKMKVALEEMRKQLEKICEERDKAEEMVAELTEKLSTHTSGDQNRQ